MTSTRRQVTVYESHESDVAIQTYCCLRCGSSVMLMTGLLGNCPRRVTDGAYIVGEEKVKKMDVNKGEVKDLLRPGRGAERQYRMTCRSCGVWFGYKTRDLDDVRNKHSYILPGIVTTNPTITLESLDAKELVVPVSIDQEKVEGMEMTTIMVFVTFGAHTKIQVTDVTSQGAVLQFRSSFEDNALAINEALLHFFSRMLSISKGLVQLLPLKTSNSQMKKIGLQKASPGFVYSSLLKVMMGMKYILPKTYDAREEAVKEEMLKRKREVED